jgi:hypothetical protein
MQAQHGFVLNILNDIVTDLAIGLHYEQLRWREKQANDLIAVLPAIAQVQ